MTPFEGAPKAGPAGSAPGRAPWLSLLLNLLGVAVVAASFVWGFAAVLPGWMLVVAVIGLVAWLVDVVWVARAPLRTPTLRVATLAVVALSGAIVAVPTAGLGVAMVVAALIRCLGTPGIPLWCGAALAVGSAAVVPTGLAAVDLPALGVLAIEAGVVIAALAGFSRRQARGVERQARELLEQQISLREERASALVTGERQAVAREIHDVLAHSLGGLTIQLDAVEALLESGRAEEAIQRVQDARRLASTGLADARRAVDALRDPLAPEPTTPDALVEGLSQLIEVHRALGCSAVFTVDRPAADGVISGHAAAALTRAMQEALTNVRKHAPGKAVSIMVRFTPDAIDLTVSNPLDDESSTTARTVSTGGGHGLRGMEERVRKTGGTVETTADSERFTLEVRVGTR